VPKKTKSKPREYTKDDVKLLKAHSKARTPVAKLSTTIPRATASTFRLIGSILWHGEIVPARSAELNHQTLQPFGSFWRPVEWRDLKRSEPLLNRSRFVRRGPGRAGHESFAARSSMARCCYGLTGY
jgi:hypothetical protein